MEKGGPFFWQNIGKKNVSKQQKKMLNCHNMELSPFPLSCFSGLWDVKSNQDLVEHEHRGRLRCNPLRRKKSLKMERKNWHVE